MITIKLKAGETTTGLWCDTCFLPSVYSIDVVADSGAILGFVSRCTGCDEE